MLDYKKILDETIEIELDGVAAITDPKEREERINYIATMIEKSIELEKMNDGKKNDKWKFAIDIGDKLIGHVVTVVGIGLNLAVIIWGTKVTLEFEETGTVTSLVGRGYIQAIEKLLNRK